MELIFNEQEHKYYYEDKELISVTRLIKKHGLSKNTLPLDNPDLQKVIEKKAERGTLIHKEIEGFVKNGEMGFTNELYEFSKAQKKLGFNVIASEKLVYNDVLAGTLDLIIDLNGQKTIADIKTTYELDYEYCSWQISLYSFLEAKDKTEYEELKGMVFHFDNVGYLSVVPVDLKRYEDVERLINSERIGNEFNQFELIELENKAQLQQLSALDEKLIEYDKLIKEREELLKNLEKYFVDKGYSKFENDKVKITLGRPTVSRSLDTTKFKTKEPEVYQQYFDKYTKVTNKKGAFKVTIKEVK